ncbi:MAG: LysE family transporter [Chitinophagaceae bacterium]|jgi:threonine/homoserine/homoserine lactone efflux protein|nr:LysE family transporter [Chitinophagaceae bacterium]
MTAPDMIGVILKGLGLGLLLSVSVGPVLFTIIKLSMRSGHKAGFAFAGGVSASDTFLVITGNMAAELLRAVLHYENTVALTGAAILFIMGAWSFFFRKDPRMDNKPLDPSLRKRDMAKYAAQGFLINTLNPGAIFFWLTTCTAFAYMPLGERSLLFGSCLLVVIAVDLSKVVLSGQLRKWLTPHTLHIINRLSAIILMAFGLIIAGSVLYNVGKN